MSTLALTDDYNFVDGETIQVLEGCDEVVQNTTIRTQIFPSEVCIFPNAGIDWKAPIMRNQAFASQIIQDEILAVDGVDAVTNFIMTSGDGRDGKFTANVSFDDDILTISA